MLEKTKVDQLEDLIVESIDNMGLNEKSAIRFIKRYIPDLSENEILTHINSHRKGSQCEVKL